MSRKLITAVALGWATGVALAMSGCGASAPRKPLDAVVRAARVTGQARGYQVAATLSGPLPTGPVRDVVTGTVVPTAAAGALTSRLTYGGSTATLDERLAGPALYLQSAGDPVLASVAGTKPWLKVDMTRATYVLGLVSLPLQETDPISLLAYLRAAGGPTARVGPATVGGVATTEYRTTVNLDRYPALAPAGLRAGAARQVTLLETALGSHVLPVDVWVDHASRVRRLSLTLPECALGKRVDLQMTIAVSGYGRVTAPVLPTAAQTFDITPLLKTPSASGAAACPAA